MTGLLGLLELLRVAQQDDVLGGTRYGKHVRERHLSRFVDKQDVDTFRKVRSRPQPRRATQNAIATLSKQRVYALVVVERVQRRRRSFLGAAFVQTLEVVKSAFVRDLNGVGQQVSNHLVAHGRDADALSASHQVDNHVRARVGLSRARRSLDRQDAVFERPSEAAGGLELCLVGDGCQSVHVARKARRAPEEQVPCRAQRTVGVDAVVCDKAAEIEQRRRFGARVHVAMDEDVLSDVVRKAP